MNIVKKAKLPESELGEDRCFDIGYFGHGDIRMSVWNGDLEHKLVESDELPANFGMAHGSDVFILSALAGYLVRIGKDQKEVAITMLGAGSDIIGDDTIQTAYGRLFRFGLDGTASGSACTGFDILEKGLSCLLTPHSNVPGALDEVGGTGIYTRTAEDASLLMVLGRFEPIYEHGNWRAELTGTEDFCESDIPTMARLVCDLAMGEYRRDIHTFLNVSYVLGQAV